jgi:hypothetical protein
VGSTSLTKDKGYNDIAKSKVYPSWDEILPTLGYKNLPLLKLATKIGVKIYLQLLCNSLKDLPFVKILVDSIHQFGGLLA